MPQCPLCHAPVKDDFGLLECSGCGAQLIVHMDGRVEYQGAREIPQVSEESNEALGDFPPDEDVMREIDLEALENPKSLPEPDAEPTQMRTARSEPAHDLVPPGGTGVGYRMPEDDLYDAARDYTAEIAQSPPSSDAGPSDEESLAAPPVEPEKEFLGASGELPPMEEELSASSDFPVEESPAHEEVDDRTVALINELPVPTAEGDLFPDFDASAAAPEAIYNSGQVSSSPDLGDVASFGNSDLSGGREGPLRYNLFIEGIDTVDVREAFREAITDRKLMWDTDQILRSVRNGRVNIQNIAPTKAYVLITRLRGTPVQIRWEQYAISQT